MKLTKCIFLVIIGAQLSFAAEISLNYRDAEIDQVLQFFSLASGKTIVKAPEVKGTVTIISQSKVSLEEGFEILKTILSLRGFTIIEEANLIKVVPLEKAIGQGTLVVGKLPQGQADESLVTQILPLKTLKAKDVARELQSLFPSPACAIALESSNALLLTDRQSHLKQLEQIIEQLEAEITPGSRPRTEELALPFRVIRLKHVDAALMAQQLAPLLTQPLATAAQTGLQPGRIVGQGLAVPQQAEGLTQGISGNIYQQLSQAVQNRSLVENQIVADTHTNSVIVTGSRQVLELISQIVAQLDVCIGSTIYPSIRNIGIQMERLAYADAQNAVNILNTIFGDSKTTRLVEAQPVANSTGQNFQRTQRQQALSSLLEQAQRPQQVEPAQNSSAAKARFAADSTTNSVVVTAPASLSDEIVELLAQLDREAAGGTELQATAVFRLKKGNASQLADMLNQVLNLSYRWNQSAGTVEPDTLKELLASLGLDPATVFAWPSGSQVRVAADVASNSLVVTSSLSAIAQLEALVAYLDQEGAPASSVFVYKLQNARASELAKTLTDLFAASGSSSNSGSRQQNIRILGYPTFGQTISSGSANEQTIRVVADDVSNSLLLAAAPQALAEVKPIIAQLDVMPPQVLIEAVVMEVTLDESTNLGLELSLNLPGGSGQIGWGSNLGSGLRYSTIDGNLSATIQALSQSSQVDILATPKIATANNKQASIKIGHQFPYLTSSKEGEDGKVQNFYTYKDVGIQLEVTPRICESGQIALDVYQTSNSFANDVTIEGGSVIAQREAKTSVIVKDGQTMVIGGMIKDDSSVYTRKVPLLGSLPVVGYLFRRQETVKNKTELVVFITPRVVREQTEDSPSQE
jgi:type II secretory pathway component GspD/PulD (secretin)